MNCCHRRRNLYYRQMKRNTGDYSTWRLANLPFAALINGQNKFLVSNHAITYAATLAAMVDSPPRYADEKSFLFASSDSSAEDLKAISVALPSSAVTYLNGEAALKNLPEHAKAKTVVHVASKLELEPNAIDSIFAGARCRLMF